MTNSNPMLQGAALRNAGQPHEALQKFDEALAHVPPNTFDAAVVHTMRGCCLQDMRRWTDAEQAFRAAIAAHEPYAVAWSNLGNTLDELERLEASVEAYDRAVALAPTEPNPWSDRGYVLKKMGRLDEAVASYDRCLALDPNHLIAWTNRGNAFLAQEKWRDAIESYDRALAIRPGFPAAAQSRAEAERRLAGGEARPVALDEITRLVNQGDAHLATGAAADALGCYIAALERDRSNLGALLGIATVYKGMQQWSKALEVEDVAVEMAPATPQLWSNRGNTLLMLDRFAEAVQSYDRGLGLDATMKTTWFNRGVALESVGRNADAVASFRRALEVDPQYEKARARIAELEATLAAPAAATPPPAPSVAPPKQGFFGRLASMFGGASTPPPAPEVRPTLTRDQIDDLLNRATQHFQRREFDQVLRLTEQVIAASPDLWEPHLNRGFALFSLGRRDEAAKELRTAVTLDKAALVTIEALLRGLAKAGAYDDVVFLAEAAIDRAPRQVSLHTMRAVSLLALGRIDEARSGALVAQALDPGNEGVAAILAGCAPAAEGWPSASTADGADRARRLMQEGEAHLDAGRLEPALACMSEAGRLDPTDPGAPAGESLILVALGRREEALPVFDRVIAMRPDWIDPLLQKADALEVLQRYPEALVEYDRALAIDPNHLAALHDRGHCLKQLGRSDEALGMYERVLSIDPNMFLSWLNKAEIERQRGRNAQALEAYQRFLACAPPDSPHRAHATAMMEQLQAGAQTIDPLQIAFNRAREADREGRTAEAVALYDEVLALRPDSIPVLHNKGTCLDAIGRHAEALACYDRVLALDPTLVASHGQRAQCLFGLKRFEEALAAYEHALMLPGAESVAPIVRHQQGRALLALGRHADALLLLEATEAQGSASDDLKIEIGLCHQALGRPDEAERHFARASPMGGRRWLHQGLAARARGNQETAGEYLRRAEESFLRMQFNRRAPDPLEERDIRLLWQSMGNPPVPDDASPFVHTVLREGASR